MINVGTIVGRYIAAIDDGIVVKISSPKSQDVPVILGDNLKARVKEYLQEDDLVGIKYNIEVDDNFNIEGYLKGKRYVKIKDLNFWGFYGFDQGKEIIKHGDTYYKIEP